MIKLELELPLSNALIEDKVAPLLKSITQLKAFLNQSFGEQAYSSRDGIRIK
jgi:hypothetical protein